MLNMLRNDTISIFEMYQPNLYNNTLKYSLHSFFYEQLDPGVRAQSFSTISMSCLFSLYAYGRKT